MTEPGRYEFDVDEQPSLDVRVDSGSLEVRNGPAGRIVVSTSSRDADWIVEAVPNGVSIQPVKRWRGRSARLVVEVPEGTRVDVRSASASVRLTGVYGETDLASASGDLQIGSPAAVNASTASGDVRVTDVISDATVRSASGDIELGRIGGRLSVTTASGDVHASFVGGDLRVGTTSGDVRIAHSHGSEIAVKSVSGDVHLGLPSGIRVEPDLTTLSGRTRLPKAASNTGDREQSPRRVVRIAVRTVSGDITIDRVD